MKVNITKKELNNINKWINLSDQFESIPEEISPDWASWVAAPVINHMLAPRHARACLELIGVLADTGMPTALILTEMKEKYFCAEK